VNQDGQGILKAMEISAEQLKVYRENRQILIHDWQQSFDAYASELIRCFDAPGQTRSNHKPVRKLSTQIR
jgi:hypothetical protein